MRTVDLGVMRLWGQKCPQGGYLASPLLLRVLFEHLGAVMSHLGSLLPALHVSCVERKDNVHSGLEGSSGTWEQSLNPPLPSES